MKTLIAMIVILLATSSVSGETMDERRDRQRKQQLIEQIEMEQMREHIFRRRMLEEQEDMEREIRKLREQLEDFNDR
jgi:F0F1-type ATP synthase epsilon subunit